MNEEKKSYLGFLLFNLVFFMMDTTSSYFSIYLNSIGFTKSMIGMVSGTAALCALVVQPVFGILCDRAPNKNRILQLLILGTGLLYPMILLKGDMLYILLVYTLYYCMRRMQPSLNTSMTVEYAEITRKDYGPIRMMGAIGYAVAMALVAQLAGIAKIGTKLTFITYTGLCLLNIALVFLLPPIKGHNSKAEGIHLPARLIFKQRPVVLLILYQMFLSVAHGLYGAYYSIYFTVDLGGSNTLFGTMLSVAALIEIPFLFFANRIIRRLGTKNTLFILGMLMGVRWLLTYLVSNPMGQFFVQCMNFTNMLNTVAIAITLSRMVEPQFKTTVQTLSVTFQSVVSILVSSYLGGFLADLVGIRPLFLIAAIIAFSATLIFCGLLMKRMNQEVNIDLSKKELLV